MMVIIEFKMIWKTVFVETIYYLIIIIIIIRSVLMISSNFLFLFI